MKRSVRIFWRIVLIGAICFAGIVVLAALGVFGEMPSMKQLENPTLLQTSEVYASDGTLMGKYYRENGNRSNVDYSDISPNVINALVSTEDIRFYHHSGIDMRGTVRAMVTLGRQGGGSTITQQLAKTLLKQSSRVGKIRRIIDKIKEYIIAVKLERNFTKEEILALYLNAVPYSENVFGIRNAARTFFQKEPDQLTVPEAAVLVGMINGPGIYNPRRNPKPALDRRNLVIERMIQNEKISRTDGEKYKLMPINMSHYKKLDENNGYAPYFREVLKNEVNDVLKGIKKPDGSSYNIYDDGLRIFTTINIKMQEDAEEAMAQWLPTLQKTFDKQKFIKTVWNDHKNILEAQMKASDRWRDLADQGLSEKEIRKTFFEKVPMKVFAWNANREKDTVMTPYDSIKYQRQMMQASFMAMDPVTGEVKAWVGGISFKTYKFDHANLNTKRQVGSSIKPFLYTEAMEERGFTPETVVENEAQYFPDYKGWVPAGKRCIGAPEVTMAGALAHSLNCASAYIMKNVGPKSFADFMQRINIPTKLTPYPSMALGACDLSLFEMMWGYSMFAGRGFTTKPYFITRIEDKNGNVIKRFDNSVERKEAISEATAYRMCRMMQGTVDIGTAAGLRGRLGAAEMGGKTGTTNDNADFWFMGYTPQLLAGTWVGCDDRFLTLGANMFQGGTVARPIWENFFKKVYADKSLGIDKDAKFSVPAEIQNEINNTDIMQMIDTLPPGAQGDDEGVGNPNDFLYQPNHEYIPPESQPVIDENKKDTVKTHAPKMGEMDKNDSQKKKKGFFKRLFGKKDNDN